MSEKSISIFLGEQLRHYRKQKGWTQEELAEKANTTAQTISNYERFGIKDTDIEAELSRILGKNLRERAEDREGTVGEVGKEILYILLENEGSVPFTSLKSYLYGMDEDRIIHEIEKISDLNMCIREQFIYFDGADRDVVYITAKGIITYKNLVNDDYHASELNALLSNVHSYEEQLKPNHRYEQDLSTALDMEDFVSKRPWITEILKLSLINTYRADYISYLYQNGALKHPIPFSRIRLMADHRDFFPGVNIYHDILYRMAYGFDDKWRKEVYFKQFDKEWQDRSEEVFSLINGDETDEDEVVSQTLRRFEKEFGWVSEDGKRGTMHPFSNVNDEKVRNQLIEENDSYDDIQSEVMSFSESEIDRRERYKELAPGGMDNVYPDKWFSKEQIEEFIRNNYHAPQNDEEKFIQKQIEEIEKLRPAMKDYYSFPKEWEENGLADLVRELCC